MKLRKKEDELHNARVDVNFMERKMLVVHEEMCCLREKNKEAMEMLKRMEKKAMICRRLFIVAVVIIVFWLLKEY